MKNKKSQVTIYISSLILAIIILTLTAIIAPAGVLFTTESVRAGEKIMLQANESISQITNTTIRDKWNGIVSTAYEAADTNIEINSYFFQYSWVIIVAIVGIVAFLYTRQLVEFQSRSGGGIV